MDPLSSTPQPLHPMNIVFFIGSFVLLFAFIGVGRIANWFAKRPVFNASRLFFWLLLLLIVGFTIWAYTNEGITLQGFRLLGQATAALLPAVVVSFFLGRRFRKKSISSNSVASNQTPQ